MEGRASASPFSDEDFGHACAQKKQKESKFERATWHTGTNNMFVL